MKKRRYKFDSAWRDAMVTADVDNPRRIEPESTFAIERTFRGAWTVIKAQIKARKERNRRAAERRRQRRQEALAAKAAAEATQTATHPATERSASTTTAAAPQKRIPTAPEPINGPRAASPQPQKPKFSDRFRGPGMKSIAPYMIINPAQDIAPQSVREVLPRREVSLTLRKLPML